MSDDGELVSRICSGDLGAFETLYEKYKCQIFRTALAVTGDQGAAEEVLQDCFVRAYRAMHRVDAALPLSPWLHRIAVNLSCSWISRNRHWPLDIENWIDRLIAGPATCPELEAEGSALQEVVRDALNELHYRQRTVVILYYVQEFSLAEIAYIVDCPVGTVKSRLHYACKALRKKLGQDQRFSGEVAYGTS